MNEGSTPRCPLCNRELLQKKCGLVCKNHQCIFYWKLGGWCLKNPVSSVWEYTNNITDKHIRWGIKRGYPPQKEKINKRHIAGMYDALRKNENLCFVIPLRYCPQDSEVVMH